jgi:hypothetical protein
VKRSGSRTRVKVSADGKGVVSHAGTVLLRELATETGLAGAVSAVLLDTYPGCPLHMPGQVFTDLAVAIADGADAVTGIEVLRDLSITAPATTGARPVRPAEPPALHKTKINRVTGATRSRPA